MGMCGQYTSELKRKTAQLLASASRSASALNCELGIRHNQRYTWQREFQARGAGGVSGLRRAEGTHGRARSAQA